MHFLELKLDKIFELRTSKEWLTGLQDKKIGCGPINNLQEVFGDAHVKARGIVENMDHPMGGTRGVDLIGSPMRFSETPVTYRHAPPLLGQHTDEVLQEKLGLTNEELSGLRERKVI